MRRSLLPTLIRLFLSSAQLMMADEGTEGIQDTEGIKDALLGDKIVCFPPETESAYVFMVSLSQMLLSASAFRDGGVI